MYFLFVDIADALEVKFIVCLVFSRSSCVMCFSKVGGKSGSKNN